VEVHHVEVLLERHHRAAATTTTTRTTGRRRRRRGVQISHHGAHLLAADVLERREPPLVEELRLAELAALTPVRTVGLVEEATAVVGGVLAGRRLRTVDEGQVVGPEEEPRRVDRRPDDDGEGAEPQGHERAIPLGELVDGAVREPADQVQVADHRPRPGARWEPVLVARGARAEPENGCEEESGGSSHYDGEEGRRRRC